MRQFGYVQHIPRDPTDIEQLHHVDLRSRQFIWHEYHSAWSELWHDREQYIQRGTTGSATLHYHGRYMEWYRRITRRWIGIPGASIGASVSVYIFPNTFILLKIINSPKLMIFFCQYRGMLLSTLQGLATLKTLIALQY